MMILSLNMKKAYKHLIILKRILFWHWQRKNKQLGEGRFWGVSEELLPFGMKDPTASQHCPTAGTCLLVGRAIGLQDHRAGPRAGSAAGAYAGSSHNTSLSTTTGEEAFKGSRKNLTASGLWFSLPPDPGCCEDLLSSWNLKNAVYLHWCFCYPMHLATQESKWDSPFRT